MKKFLLRKIPLIIAVTVSVCLSSTVFASVLVDSSHWSGSRSAASSGGLMGFGEWGGFTVNWEITLSGSEYTYTYTLTTGTSTRAISHWNLELSEDVDWDTDDFDDGSTWISDEDDGIEIGTLTQDSGNPGMPSDMYGVKWNTMGDPLNLSITFTTEQAPVWGDFYAKDGTGTYVYNDEFGSDPLGQHPVSGNFSGWVARPNGDLIPEPTSILCWSMLAISGVSFVRRRKIA